MSEREAAIEAALVELVRLKALHDERAADESAGRADEKAAKAAAWEAARVALAEQPREDDTLPCSSCGGTMRRGESYFCFCGATLGHPDEVRSAPPTDEEEK